MRKSGLRHLHLATAALDRKEGQAFHAAIRDRGWTVSATMVGFPQEDYSSLETIRRTGGIIPDACWEKNRDIVLEAIDRTVELGVPFLTTHMGFIDHADKAAYETFCNRARELADAAADKGVMLLMETGQETAEDLKQCLLDLDHGSLGVNFDPANMILYDKGNPITAIGVLAPWIHHVHIKDAVRTSVPGEWGREVPWGDGEVDPEAFFAALDAIGYTGPLAIEREAGEARINDITRAAERLTIR